jgi:hypothetical protein
MGFGWGERILTGLWQGRCRRARRPGSTRVDRGTPSVTRLPRLPLDESTPCESELFGVGEDALN